MFNNIHNRNGFTLIEVMIVVVIIGILAAIAIPRLKMASEKVRQKTGVEKTLKNIYTMQRLYRSANNPYGDNGVIASAGGSFSQIDVNIPEGDRYEYEMFATGNTFITIATSNIDDDPTIDTWVVDQTGHIEHTVDDLTG